MNEFWDGITGWMHSHPLWTVAIMGIVVYGVFLWAIFDGSRVERSEELQQGGDWARPS